MSVRYISEFGDLPFTSNGSLDSAANSAAWQADQTVAISATSTPSNAFGNGTRCVVLSADTACHITWTAPGATINPATSSSQPLPANMPKLFGVAPGMKLSLHS